MVVRIPVPVAQPAPVAIPGNRYCGCRRRQRGWGCLNRVYGQHAGQRCGGHRQSACNEDGSGRSTARWTRFWAASSLIPRRWPISRAVFRSKNRRRTAWRSVRCSSARAGSRCVIWFQRASSSGVCVWGLHVDGGLLAVTTSGFGADELCGDVSGGDVEPRRRGVPARSRSATPGALAARATKTAWVTSSARWLSEDTSRRAAE